MKLKGVRRQRRGDKVIRYHRATGTRLPDDIPETHPDFVAAWARAEAGQRPAPALAPKAGTLAAACTAFKASPACRSVSKVYRAILAHNMDAIQTDYGHVAVAAIRQKHISADLAKLEGTRPLARLKTWRKLMDHAKQTGLIEDDPSLTIKAPKVAKGPGHEPWSAGEIERYRSHWPVGTSQRACFELLLWTGARTIDAVRIGPQHVGKDGVLAFRQSKTGGMAYVPWAAPLPVWAQVWRDERRGVIEALGCLSGDLTFIPAHGRPRSEKGLSNLISRGAKAAKVTGKTAHGLRKSRLTMIADAGGSAHAIMAWGGHASLAEAQHYTRTADARRLVSGMEQEQNAVSPAERDTKMAENG